MSQPLPEMFKVGNTVKAQSLGSPYFTVHINEIQGDWIHGDFVGENSWKGVWLHVPPLPYLWAKVETVS